MSLLPVDLEQYGALFQPSAADKKQAMNMGLLNFGLGILANNGRVPYGTAGQSIGAGGLQGMQAYQGALSDAQRQRESSMVRGMQFRKMEQEEQERQRRQGALAKLTGILGGQQQQGILGQPQPDPNQAGLLFSDVDPQTGTVVSPYRGVSMPTAKDYDAPPLPLDPTMPQQAQQQQPTDNRRQMAFTMIASGDPELAKLGVQTLLEKPEKDKPQLVTVQGPDGGPMQRWVKPGETTGVDVGAAYEKPPEILDPRVQAAKERIARAGKSDVNTVVNLTEEKEESKAVGKAQGEMYANLQKSGLDASNKINKISRMEQLMAGVTTGRLAPTATELRAIAQGFGLSIGEEELASAQGLQALTREVALELRNPSGGAGMPGALSDKDREFLVSMAPGLEKSPEGNKMIIETAKKVAKRDQEVAKMAREYRKKNGHIDEGFQDVLQAYSDANPLFADTAASTPKRRSTDKTGAVMRFDAQGNLIQ